MRGEDVENEYSSMTPSMTEILMYQSGEETARATAICWNLTFRCKCHILVHCGNHSNAAPLAICRTKAGSPRRG